MSVFDLTDADLLRLKQLGEITAQGDARVMPFQYGAAIEIQIGGVALVLVYGARGAELRAEYIAALLNVAPKLIERELDRREVVARARREQRREREEVGRG